MRRNFFYFWVCLGAQKLVILYQKLISPFLPSSCRYYPSCSEYALWSLQFNQPLRAFYQIFSRILRCNQFFKGGIDYPIGHRVLEKNFSTPKKITFWLIPLAACQCPKTKFYIIKSL
ncbi:membrane protein insertion efficiency factor YidD [Helicobacter sp. 12S02634-8]|uniref:membrane protein insertion efficiency factor YidD n=1 Tax=Helicobacter sp. 12S02634-8 TaxID=1476199 RepID=UPI000BA7D675|nr:membrane protein insertion efficiency factor YidD [Helicobacter sp. 12S02634-8]PAF48018.1 membrane protein insertion efficiency factor YidD [Helicobacter sp. 12S02634-8]